MDHRNSQPRTHPGSSNFSSKNVLSCEPETLLAPDKIKPVSSTHVEIRFSADAQLKDLLDQVRGLLAHRMPNASLGELISEMAKICITKLEPKKPRVLNSSSMDTDSYKQSTASSSNSNSCKTHNLTLALEDYGRSKMSPYLKG